MLQSQKSDPNIKELKQRSLKYSLYDGIFASGMVGFTQEYFTPFLLLLGGQAKHVGMLSALPNLFASLVQVKSPDITRKLKSRRKIINTFVLLQALMLLPILSLALQRKGKPGIFISYVVMFSSFVAIANPAWGSLMSDLVEKNERGRYFGWRSRILGYITVISALLAGLILHKLKTFDPFRGFVVIFASAFIFRMASWYFLTKMYEPPILENEEHYFTLVDFLGRLKESNFAQFVMFVSAMSFSVNVASPFFAVLMLRDLNFSYLLYTAVTITATLTTYTAASRWGRHADKVGNLKIIKLTSPLIGLIPFLWIVSRKPLFLFFVQVFSGFVWSGFNLCTMNFIYDAVMPEKRTRCISYFNAFNGLAICSGALLGGFLVPRLPALFGYKILTLFLISSLLRLIVGSSLSQNLKEVRPVAKVKTNELFFSMLGIRPLVGMEKPPSGH